MNAIFWETLESEEKQNKEKIKQKVREEIRGRKEERFNLNTENRRDFKLHERIVNIEGNRDVCWYRSIYTLFIWENKYYSWSDKNFLELSRAIFWEDDEEVKKLEESIRAKLAKKRSVNN